MKFNKLTAAILLTTVLVSTNAAAGGGGKVEPRKAEVSVMMQWYNTAISWFTIG